MLPLPADPAEVTSTIGQGIHLATSIKSKNFDVQKRAAMGLVMDQLKGRYSGRKLSEDIDRQLSR
jgi:hypothetical protein